MASGFSTATEKSYRANAEGRALRIQNVLSMRSAQPAWIAAEFPAGDFAGRVLAASAGPSLSPAAERHRQAATRLSPGFQVMLLEQMAVEQAALDLRLQRLAAACEQAASKYASGLDDGNATSPRTAPSQSAVATTQVQPQHHVADSQQPHQPRYSSQPLSQQGEQRRTGLTEPDAAASARLGVARAAGSGDSGVEKRQHAYPAGDLAPKLLSSGPEMTALSGRLGTLYPMTAWPAAAPMEEKVQKIDAEGILAHMAWQQVLPHSDSGPTTPATVKRPVVPPPHAPAAMLPGFYLAAPAPLSQHSTEQSRGQQQDQLQTPPRSQPAQHAAARAAVTPSVQQPHYDHYHNSRQQQKQQQQQQQQTMSVLRQHSDSGTVGRGSAAGIAAESTTASGTGSRATTRPFTLSVLPPALPAAAAGGEVVAGRGQCASRSSTGGVRRRLSFPSGGDGDGDAGQPLPVPDAGPPHVTPSTAAPASSTYAAPQRPAAAVAVASRSAHASSLVRSAGKVRTPEGGNATYSKGAAPSASGPASLMLPGSDAASRQLRAAAKGSRSVAAAAAGQSPVTTRAVSPTRTEGAAGGSRRGTPRRTTRGERPRVGGRAGKTGALVGEQPPGAVEMAAELPGAEEKIQRHGRLAWQEPVQLLAPGSMSKFADVRDRRWYAGGVARSSSRCGQELLSAKASSIGHRERLRAGMAELDSELFSSWQTLLASGAV